MPDPAEGITYITKRSTNVLLFAQGPAKDIGCVEKVIESRITVCKPDLDGVIHVL